MENIKKLLVIAKWEFFRPTKSKFSFVSVFVLIATMLIMPFTVSNLEQSEISLGITSYKIFKIGTNDAEIKESLSRYKEFDVFLINENISSINDPADISGIAGTSDIYIKSDGGDISVSVIRQDTGSDAVVQVIDAIRAINRENLPQGSPSVLVSTIYIDQNTIGDIIAAGEQESEKENKTSAENESKDEKTESELMDETLNLLSASSKTSQSTPSEISMPFPFEKSFLSFLLIAPLLFFSMFFSSALVREKEKRRGEVLFSLPVPRAFIPLGKMLPYVFFALSISMITAYFLGLFSAYALLTILALSIILLSAAGIVVLLTRSAESANFTLVFLYLSFFAYLFYPTMFSGIETPNIANLSPLTAMTNVEEIGYLEFFRIFLPNLFTALVLLWIFTSLFKEDVIFGSRSAFEKLSDIYEVIERSAGKFSKIISGIVPVPVVFIIELFLLFLLFPLGGAFLLPLVLISVVVEEFAKIYGISVLLKRGLIPGTPGGVRSSAISGAIGGALAGAGFFAGEKMLTLISIFNYITQEGQVFLFIEASIPGFVIHIICAAIAGFGLGRTKGRFNHESLLFIAAAIAVHFAYILLSGSII